MNIYYIDYDTTEYTLYYKGYKLDKITRNIIEEYDFKKVLYFDINDTGVDKYYYGTCEFKGLTTDYCIIQRYNTKKTIISYDYEIICPVTSQTVEWDTTYATFDYTGVTIIHYSDGTTSRNEEALQFRTDNFGQNISTAQKTHTYYINYNGTLQQVEVIQKKQGAITGYTYELQVPITSKTVEWSATTAAFNYTGITIAHYDDGTTAVTNEEALIYRTPTFAQNESDVDITHNFIINFHDKYQDVEVIHKYKIKPLYYTYELQVPITSQTVEWSATTASFNYTGITIAHYNDGSTAITKEEELVYVTPDFGENTTDNNITHNFVINFNGEKQDVEVIQKYQLRVTGYTYNINIPITSQTVDCNDTTATFNYTATTIAHYQDGTTEIINQEELVYTTPDFGQNTGTTDLTYTYIFEHEFTPTEKRQVTVEVIQLYKYVISESYEIYCPVTSQTVNWDVTTARFDYILIKTLIYNDGSSEKERKPLHFTTPDFGQNTSESDYKYHSFKIVDYGEEIDVQVIQIRYYEKGGYFRFVAIEEGVTEIIRPTILVSPRYSTDAKTWKNWDGTTRVISKGETLYVIANGLDESITMFHEYNFKTSQRVECHGDIRYLLSMLYPTSISSLSRYQFQRLFLNSQIITPPDLPATTLNERCYWLMFAGCTSLVIAPELPATTLGVNCYEEMFSGCTSLVTAPALPVTELIEGCYMEMFMSCTSLVNAPELPATTLVLRCYENMFSDCTSLVTAPELQGTNFPPNPKNSESYLGMFSGCTSLVNAPELPATTLGCDCYPYMFAGCTSLETAPALPATNLNLADFGTYRYMFSGCTSLKTAPELPATTLGGASYESMFAGCTSLVNAPELLATSVPYECYKAMFAGCTSLKTAPELPATDLGISCYKEMFSGCTSLNYIKVGATNWRSYYSSTSYYVSDNWTLNVSPTGTFYKPSGTSIPSGSSGIPSGWTVVNY